MINHLRTLLLNEKGSNNPGSRFPLEEYADPIFVPEIMPFGCAKIWKFIFGSNPDRAYKNWRLYQIAQLAESSDLLSHWYKFDNRLTYMNQVAIDESKIFNKIDVINIFNGNLVQFINSDNGVIVDPGQLPKDSEEVGILLSGTIVSNESVGQCKSVWKIEVTSSVSVEITDLTYGYKYYDTLEYSAGLSQPVNLPGTGVSVRIRYVSENGWDMAITAKPNTDLGVVLANLKNVANYDINYVLTGDYSEYKIFYDYWHKNSNSAEQLSAIALGLAYKLEETRTT